VVLVTAQQLVVLQRCKPVLVVLLVLVQSSHCEVVQAAQPLVQAVQLLSQVVFQYPVLVVRSISQLLLVLVQTRPVVM
jgi:hypothetical protein